MNVEYRTKCNLVIVGLLVIIQRGELSFKVSNMLENRFAGYFITILQSYIIIGKNVPKILRSDLIICIRRFLRLLLYTKCSQEVTVFTIFQFYGLQNVSTDRYLRALTLSIPSFFTFEAPGTYSRQVELLRNTKYSNMIACM